jgi:hypothetical protein
VDLSKYFDHGLRGNSISSSKAQIGFIPTEIALPCLGNPRGHYFRD